MAPCHRKRARHHRGHRPRHHEEPDEPPVDRGRAHRRAFDSDPASLDNAEARGAHRTGSPREAASGAAVVLLSLPTPAIVDEVVTGEDGIIAGLAPGSLVVDHSTIDPDTTRRMHARVVEGGSSFLDAPVSGGPQAMSARA